jgi:1,2-diacylglycerol 3-beta-galactosyltransferase
MPQPPIGATDRTLRRKVALIYVDSGAGHRAAATALSEVIQQQQRPWELEMLSIQDLLDSIDFIRKFTGIPFQDIYNIMLRRGWTAGSAQLITLGHLLIRLSHRSQVGVLERYWAESQPDMVVSLIPHYNRALKEALDRSRPGAPFVTLITDIADYPPHFWIERQDQYVICGSERAASQARELGMAADRILQTSGMILHPKFYEPLQVNRAAERVRLGLRPDLLTGLVLFGGEGSAEMVRIAQALNRAESRVQLILLCGKNAEVISQLRAMDRRIPMWIEGFTREVPFYMELSDFFIGKPGPGSISEALVKRLPVVVQRNAWTMAHERYNADWIEEQQVGLVVRSFFLEISAAVETLAVPEHYSRFRQRVASMRNLAVYEVPVLLEKILSQSNRNRPDPAHPALVGSPQSERQDPVEHQTEPYLDAEPTDDRS